MNKKTALLLSMITILLISGSVFLVTVITKSQLLDEYQTEKETTINVLSFSLANMLSLYDHKQIENLISSSLNYKKITYISVFNQKGKLIRSVTQKDLPQKQLDIEYRKITTDLDGIIGSVEVGYSKAYIKKRIGDVTTALILSLTAGFLLVGLCLYSLMSRYVIEPLESLTDVVEKMDANRLSSRAKVFRKDEIGALATSFNIMTENLEKSNQAIRESEIKYRSMMEAMSDSVYICSPDYTIEYMNPALIKDVGRDATGEYCHQVVFGSTEKCPWCRFGAIHHEKNVTFDVIVPKDNQHYQISNAALIHSDGTLSMLNVLRNTTELKSLEFQLMQAQKMESIGTLAAGIAHDFNNILSAIFGYTEIALHKAPSGSTVRADLSEVLKAGERARSLVAQILTFSRKPKSEKKPTQVHRIVEEVLNFLRSSLPSTIRIEQHAQGDHDTIIADPTQIHQIVMNVCTNASQAMMEKGGVLKVKLESVKTSPQDLAQYPEMAPGNYLELIVSDTGCGMSPVVLNSVFEPYFTTKEKGTGTGLGMAVALSILKSHNGHIRIDSKPAVGSTFYIYFPLVDEQEKKSVEVEAPLPTGKERILIVDDEHAIAQIQKQWLEILGYTVFTENDSTKALQLFRNRSDRIDLVISDQTMPNMTGETLAVELKKIRSDIPIILCTGYTNVLSEEKTREIGIDRLVMKPLKWKELAIIVRNVLGDG